MIRLRQMPLFLKHPLIKQLFAFISFIWQQLQANQWRQSAAALTYTSLFALVPIMTVSYVLLSFMPQLETIQGRIEGWIFTHFLPDTGSQVSGYLQIFSQQARSLTLAGVIMLIITALMMLKTIENAFNNIWDIKQGRKGLVSFLLYWAILSLGPVLIGSALVFSTYLLSLNLLNGVEQLTVVQQALSYLPLILSTCALCLMYYAVPNCTVPLKHALAGAFVTAIVFGLIKHFFALSVKYSSYTLVYGAFAAVPLFLMWIYLCWMTVLFGAVLVRSFSTFPFRQNMQQSNMMMALMVLRAFWHAQQKGIALPAAIFIHGNADDLSPLGIAPWEQLRDVLLKHRYLQATTDNSFILSRDLHNVSLWDIQQLFQPAESQQASSPKDLNESPWLVRAQETLQLAQNQNQQTLSLSLTDLFQNS